MKKDYKTIFLIVLVVMIFISVISIIYSINNINKSTEAANSLEQQYLTLSASAVEKCQSYSSEIEDGDDYASAIKEYATNIDSSENAKLKAYIANAMITYAQNYVAVKNVELEVYGSTSGTTSPYSRMISELNEIKIQLDNIL